MEEQKRTDPDEITLIELAQVAWRGRWWILSLTVVFSLVTLVYALLLKDEFTSTAVVTPITSAQGSSAALAQYAGLAAMAGINLPASGGGGDAAAVAQLLGSRSLRDRLILKLDLPQRLFESPEFKDRDPVRATEEALAKQLTLKTGTRDTAITLEVTTHDAQLSFEILQQALIELESMLNEYNLDKAQKNISLIEQQVREQSQKLSMAQQAMAMFQTQNRLLDPSSQSAGYIQLFQTLTGQRIQLEVQLRQLENVYNSSDSRIQALISQLDSLNVQIKDLENTGGGIGAGLNAAPELMIEYQNLFRDLEIAQRLYGTLLASLDQARLTANQEQVFVRVIDAPLVPDIKSGPSRVLLLLTGSIVALLLSILLVLSKYILSKIFEKLKLKTSIE